MTKFSRYLLAFFAGLVILTSCVPNKRIVYLQNPPEPKHGEVSNADTSSRKYQTHFKEYQLKAGDIITVRIASITPSEFDFVQKYEEQLGLIRKLNQYEQSNQSSGTTRMGNAGTSSNSTQGGGIAPITLDRQQTGFFLDPEGNLELPYVGRLKLEGLTLKAAENLVTEKLKGYFETPVVRIQLLSFHFTILGEVNNEGRYTVFDQNANIIDAITLAGNLNDFADRSKIKIVRFTGTEAEVFYVNTLREDLLGQPGFFLQPNDLVIVPPLKARASKKYTLPAYTTTISIVSTTLTFLFLILSLNNN
jgi:polysaccharide biosynthesis/export protein